MYGRTYVRTKSGKPHVGRPLLGPAKIHFITLEYLWKAHLLSVETSASMKGWLRSERIFKSLIYGKSNDILTWDIWQAGESGVALSGVTLAYKDG